MADNIELNPGTGGADIATDEYGGAHYQKILIAYDAAGAPAVANEDGLPVSVKNPSIAVTNDALTELAAAIVSDVFSVDVKGGATVKYANVNENTAADHEIVPSVSGKQIRVLGYQLSNSGAAAVDVTWKNGATAMTGAMGLAVDGSLTVPPSMIGCFQTSAASALNLNLSGAQQVSGWIAYIEV